MTMTTLELTGIVMMRRRLEKFHVLLGLLLMTQYFTSVMLSVAGASSSSSEKLLLSESPSSSSTSFSEETFSSLSLPFSANPSWPTLTKHKNIRTSPLKHHYNSHRNSDSVGGSVRTFLIISEDDDEVSSISASRPHFRKHQKRHAGVSDVRNVSSTSVDSHKNNYNHNLRNIQALDMEQVNQVLSNPSMLQNDSRSENESTRKNGDGESDSEKRLKIPLDDGEEDIGNGVRRGAMCRHGDRGYMPAENFYLDTCAYCYRYMKDDLPTFGKPSKKLKTIHTITAQRYTLLMVVWNRTAIVANISDPDSPIWDSFANEEAKKDWKGCCIAARECCEKMMKQEADEAAEQADLDGRTMALNLEMGMNVSTPVEKECPPTWDGWQCWDSTKAGVTAQSYCPNYIYFLIEPPSCSIPVHKECAPEGYWAKKDGTGKEWTNYAVCAMSTVKSQSNRAFVLVTAYAISIVALVPAIIIFFTFKQLRVHRIILHQNIFLSLLLNALLVIIFKTSVMMSEANTIYGSDVNSTVRQNSIGCRLLLLSTKYSRMTNYMWMFCEGFYLHKLIAAAFAEQKSLLVFYMIGWVFPLFPTAFYAGYRMLYANNECWVVPQDEWEWAFYGPSLLSLLVNTLFLINIIRVLVTKLRAAHAQEPSQYRKAVRATLVLLPLFGLHFIVTIYRPPSTSGVCGTWAELYFYMNDTLDGMQGFLVALIFCYCNGEVLSLLKRSYIRWKEQHFDVGRRHNSRHRPSRGSVMGRSVVSTHIYSSIPPSPETNVIAVPCGGESYSNPSSKDPSLSTTTTTINTANVPTASNVLSVNGASGTTSPNVHVIFNSTNNSSTTATTTTISPPNGKKSLLKNRKNNHTASSANGNAVNMYVSSEYGSLKENPGVEISCV